MDVSSQGNGAIIQDDKTATTELCKVYCAVKYNQSYRGVGSGDRQSSKSLHKHVPEVPWKQKTLRCSQESAQVLQVDVTYISLMYNFSKIHLIYFWLGLVS